MTALAHQLPAAERPPFVGHDRLACQRTPAVFTTDNRDPGHKNAVRVAKRICRGCPLRRACAQWALDTRQSGVYGATSDADRAFMRRRGVRYVP